MKHGQIVECSAARELSNVTIIDRCINGRREYFLKHHGIGFEPAGSMARWSAHEMWSVTFYDGGATNGRRFLNLGEAQDLFDKWSGRDVEINAQIIRDEIRAQA